MKIVKNNLNNKMGDALMTNFFF